MEPSIYQFPDIFRRVHMERPGEIEEETAFLQEVWRRHYRRPVRRVLDLACGNSPHGQILARTGIEIVGVDDSLTMLSAGRVESRRLDAIRFYRRKIERFKLPELAFDTAIFMCETFPVLRTNAALLSHLKSVAAMLKRGGLYCIDIDRHDGVDLVTRRRLWRERKVRISLGELDCIFTGRRDGVDPATRPGIRREPKVKVGFLRVDVREFHRPIAWYDAMHSIYELECTIHFPDRKVVTRDLIPVRYISPPIIDLIARASGCFKVIACYPDLCFTRPLDQCEGRWFAILKRS